MKKRSILIVEDSKTARIQLAGVLEKSGYSVQTAENGQDALEKYKEYHYPIVITDLEMPVMTGYELIDKFSEMKEQPLIIVISNNDKLETIIDIMKKGVFDYTVKPLTSNDLLIKIDRAFLAYDRNKIYRIKQKEKTVGTIFRNLQRSFNQGAGIGTQMTLVQMIIDHSEEQNDKYCIDKTIFDQIKQNQEMVKKALRGLSEMERIMFQDIELELTNCGDIGELLKELKTELKNKEDIANHNIIINGITPELSSYPIDMNKSYLKKAITEILINAMKFSVEKSDVIVDVNVEEYTIQISITNSPITYQGVAGIPVEFEESIYEPFFRIENFINEKYETSELGLGLLVVKKILNEHEGDIEIVNIDGDKKGEVKVKCVISLPIYKQID